MTVQRLSDLEPRRRRRVLLRSVLSVALVWAASLAADFPGLRAVEGLAVIFPLFLLVFAALYLALSRATPATFSQELDHTRALDFAITVFSTVGFGDITPTTNTARIVVSIQMLLDLVVIGLVVRLIVNAAKSRIGPSPEGSTRG